MFRFHFTGWGWTVPVIAVLALGVGAGVGGPIGHGLSGAAFGAALAQIPAAYLVYLLGRAVNSRRTPDGRQWDNGHTVSYQRTPMQVAGVGTCLVIGSIIGPLRLGEITSPWLGWPVFVLCIVPAIVVTSMVSHRTGNVRAGQLTRTALKEGGRPAGDLGPVPLPLPGWSRSTWGHDASRKVYWARLWRDGEPEEHEIPGGPEGRVYKTTTALQFNIATVTRRPRDEVDLVMAESLYALPGAE